MSLIGNISRKASERNLPFIVIGGHAVMAYGFIRTTSNWDFLICKEQAGEWRAAMESLGFGLHFTGATFLQFQPPPGEPAALDLMLVDERPPQINPQVMLRRIAENMAWHNRRPGEQERRLAEKIPVEFVL